MNSLVRRGKSYIGAVSGVVFATKRAGRELTIFPDDVFLVSYVRSGSTWSRFLFGNLVHPDEAMTFVNLDRLLPSIYTFPDRVLRSLPLPRVLKSHECFDPRYPRVIHIVRDPRDVAVSFYYYNLKVRVLPDGFPMEEFVVRFVAGQTVDYADRLGSWEDNTLSWLRMRRASPNYRLIRYEDLLANPVNELANVISLLRTKVTPETIERAVKLSSASEMRLLEQQQWKKWESTKRSRRDIPFVRQAKSGNWKEQLSESSVRRIEAAWGPTMQELGYELSG